MNGVRAAGSKPCVLVVDDNVSDRRIATCSRRDVKTDRTGVRGMVRCFRKTEKLTYRELAARIGSSPEAVSKCLMALSGKGIVKESGGTLLTAHNALERLGITRELRTLPRCARSNSCTVSR